MRKGFSLLRSYGKSTHWHGCFKLGKFPELDTTNGAKVDPKERCVWKKIFCWKNISSLSIRFIHTSDINEGQGIIQGRNHGNHKRVGRLMRELGIQSVIRKKRLFYGRRGSVVFPNVLNREFCADHSFQKLVTDITYVRVGDTFAYLSAVLDLYNNGRVGIIGKKRS